MFEALAESLCASLLLHILTSSKSYTFLLDLSSEEYHDKQEINFLKSMVYVYAIQECIRVLDNLHHLLRLEETLDYLMYVQRIYMQSLNANTVYTKKHVLKFLHTDDFNTL